MTIRPLFLATLFACAVFQPGFEIGGAETVYPGTAPFATQHRSSVSKRLPSRVLSALGAATNVARIHDAFPATNEPGRIRSQVKATAKSDASQTRPVTLPSSSALAVVNASEPRPAAPTMKPFVDPQVMAASYAAPMNSAERTANARTENMQNSENPLRETGPTGRHIHSTSSGLPSQNATANPLR